MRVRFAAKARKDIQDIGDYIARDSRRVARRVVSEIETFCVSLDQSPERYAIFESRAERGVRRAPVGSYVLFYRIDADGVLVLRIIHAARDIETVAFYD